MVGALLCVSFNNEVKINMKKYEKKILNVLCFLFFGIKAFSQVADDGFIVPLNQDFSKSAVSAQSASAELSKSSSSKIQQGAWIEVTSKNESLIRNISDGKKSGYEFDNSHFLSKMNWWFWGDINDKFHLDTEIAVWNFDKTIYQSNSYGANIPDVTFGDGLQTLLTMPFSFLAEGNDSGIGAFNKMGFNILTPFVSVRVGYGDLKANGMSEFKGIFTVIDRWNNVGKGYTEISGGSALKNFGKLKVDSLFALSRMRDSFGTYDYIDFNYDDKVRLAFTFGSTTTEKELFFYTRSNKNAVSAWLSLSPFDWLTVQAHALGSFGTEYSLSSQSTAFAGKISSAGESYDVSLRSSYAGSKVNSVWGSDGTDWDDINAGTWTTDLLFEKQFGLSVPFSLGLDQKIAFDNLEDFSSVKCRFQIYSDITISSNAELGLYGVMGLDKQLISPSSAADIIPYFDEGGAEVVLTDLKNIQKLRFDYALKMKYGEWSGGNSYPAEKQLHSIMGEFQFASGHSVHFGSILRIPGKGDETNVPFAFAAGTTIKKLPLPGKPMLWVHFTYSMNPYEDKNYSLFRKDDPLNKPAHRTYLLNSLEKDTGKSMIGLGLVWDL